MVELSSESDLQVSNDLDVSFREIFDLEHTSRELRQAVMDVLTEYPEYGFYFFNQGAFKQKISFLKEQFLPDTEAAKVAYAVKANPRTRILQLLQEYGIDTFDCASPGEIESVLRVNPNAKILYNNPRKLKREIKAASRMGVRHYTAHNQRGVDKILENVIPYDSESPIEIAVRMQTLNENAEINLSTKFGTTPDEVRRIVQYLVFEAQVIPGIAVNAGSQNKNPEIYRKIILQIAEIIKDIRELLIINLGGGFPVNYHEKDQFDLRNYFKVINQVTHEVLHSVISDENAQIIIEPGRSVIADSVDLFVPVIERETREGRPCITIADGIFTSFSDYAIHGWKYPFRPFSIEEKTFTDNKTNFTVFGQTCDSGDKINSVELPNNIDEGDYLWVPGAGAYLDSQASQFNGFLPHRYVFYNSN